MYNIRGDYMDLQKVERLRTQLTRRTEELSNLRELRLHLTTPPFETPRAHNFKSRLEEMTLRILDAEHDLERLRVELENAIADLTEAILHLDEPTLMKRLLILRYVEGKSFRKCARMLNYSLSRVFQMHDRFIANEN